MASLKYLIRVDIHEVKDVIFKEPETERELVPDLFIKVAVGGQVNKTVSRSKASNAIFNKEFNFTVDLTQADFQRERIIVSLHHEYTFQTGYVGHHAFSLPLIYSKQQHCIHRSWVRVFNPMYPTHNAGSLLTSIAVSAPGDKPPIFKDNEDLSGHAMTNDPSQSGIRFNKVPEMNLKGYMIYVNAVCGREFKAQGGLLGSTIEPYVKISHFGMEEETHIFKDVRDPEWQTTLYLPCITPSFVGAANAQDELVTVEVWNGSSSKTLLHFESIDLVHLINNEYPPRWINIYYQLKENSGCRSAAAFVELVKDSFAAKSNELTDFGGRLLISASAEHVQTLYVKGTKPCRSIALPATQQRIIAVDLYGIVSLVSTPNIITVVVSHGSCSTRSAKLQKNQNGSYKINNHTGSLREFESTFQSNDDGDVCDLFVYVYDVSNWSEDADQRVAWARITYEKAKASEGKPMWIQMMSFGDKNLDLFRVLISIDVSSNVANYARKDRLEYTLTKYIFRSMVYEALHLPCTGNNAYPSSRVEVGARNAQVELAGCYVRSKVAPNTINPYFFEAREEEVLLPTNLLLAPDININVYAEPTSMFATRQLLCSGQYSLAKVPKEWKKAPQWLKLKSKMNPLHRPKILIAFELVLYEEFRRAPELFNFFDDIVPSTIPCTLSLLVIGIRTFMSMGNHRVDIRFRDYESVAEHRDAAGEFEEQRDVRGSTGAPVAGRYGNWNYLTSHDLELELPKRMQHHACLEFQIAPENYRGALGSTFLTLNQFLPWLSEEERNTSVELFKMQCLDDFNAVDRAQSEAAPAERRTEEIKNINIQMLEKIDMVSLHKSKFSQEPEPEPVSSAASTHYAETEDAEEKPEAADAADEAEREAERAKLEEEMDFEILVDDNANEIVRDELPYEMESEFDCEDLPYMKAPIVKFTPSGIPEVIGTVKFILSITETRRRRRDGKPSKGEWRDTAELAAIRQRIQEQKAMLHELYRQAKDLVVRAYVLEAKGLYCSSVEATAAGMFIPSLSGEMTTFVWIRNVDPDQAGEPAEPPPGAARPRAAGYPNSIRDEYNTKRGLKPVFNACYNVSCSLPENSVLQISVVSRGTLKDEVIGTTFIDCEDRFFNKHLQQLMLEDCAPIESRMLKAFGGASALGEITISRGVLRLWIEMMDLQTAKMKPVQNLGSLDPGAYELRVVVWKARYFNDEASSISLFVRGIYQNEADEAALDTDTHYHSKDNTGTFNWRFKFKVTIPTEYTTLKLQLYSTEFFKSELLGEANVDLASEFHKVRKKNSVHAVPKFTANFYSLQSSSKVVGNVDVEVSVLNESDSKRYLVGVGRDPPNRDPFLPAVLENRTMLDLDGFKDTMAGAAGSIVSFFKVGIGTAVTVGVTIFVVMIIIALK